MKNEQTIKYIVRCMAMYLSLRMWVLSFHKQMTKIEDYMAMNMPM